MLAKLALSPKEQRPQLFSEIETYFSQKVIATEASPTSLKIVELYKHKESLYEETLAPPFLKLVLGLLGLSERPAFETREQWRQALEKNLASLDEASWVRLVCLCDPIEQGGFYYDEVFYEAIVNLINKAANRPSLRFHAYCFLKSQDQHGDICNSQRIATFISTYPDTNLTAEERKQLLVAPPDKIIERAPARKSTHQNSASKDALDCLTSDAFYSLDNYRTVQGEELDLLINRTYLFQRMLYEDASCSCDRNKTIFAERVGTLHSRFKDNKQIYQQNFDLLMSGLIYFKGQLKQTNNDTSVKRQSIKKLNQLFSGHLVHGKDAKIPVFEIIIDHLSKYKSFDPNHTDMPDAPFLFTVYIDAYVYIKAYMKVHGKIPDQLLSSRNKEQLLADMATKGLDKEIDTLNASLAYSEENIKKMEDWATKIMFDRLDVPETDMFMKIPKEHRQSFFAGTYIDFESLRRSDQLCPLTKTHVDKEEKTTEEINDKKASVIEDPEKFSLKEKQELLITRGVFSPGKRAQQAAIAREEKTKIVENEVDLKI